MNEETVQTGEVVDVIQDGSEWSTPSTIGEVVELDRPF